MCLLAILFRVVDDCPLVIAANREEAYVRGGTALDLRPGDPCFIAGLDPVAGGTWLGINAHRMVVAVTNRPKSTRPDSPRSRGLLVNDLLRIETAREAAQTASRELAIPRYAGCNIICADADSVWVIHGGDWLRIRSLAPGCHVMTNGDVNDHHDDRVVWSMEHLHRAAPKTADDALAVLRFIAAHTGPEVPICLHGVDRGTVASTLLALGATARGGKLLHVHGSPAQAPYSDRTDLLWEMEQRFRMERS